MSDQRQRLKKQWIYPLNRDGPGGGQSFVLLVTLITPWWIQMSLFLLLCPILSASCGFLSTNYCVYAYLRHAVQKYRLSGSNYAKTDKCPVKQVKLLTRKYVIFFFSHNLENKDIYLLFYFHSSVVLTFILFFFSKRSKIQ